MAQPQVTKRGILDMQVCVPDDWADEDIKTFANRENPSGIRKGWHIRRNEEDLQGDPVYNSCNKQEGYVHVMLEC